MDNTVLSGEVLLELEEDFSAEIIAILAFLASLESRKIIRFYLEQGNIEKINDYIEIQFRRLVPLVSDAIIRAGQAEAKLLEAQLRDYFARRGIPRSAIIVNFSTNERVARLIREQTDSLIRNISNSQRIVIYRLINEMLSTGANSVKITNEIVKFIGLNDYQKRAIENYRKLLEENSKKALNHALRDPNFDSDFGNLTPSQIDKMVDAYRKNQILHRAKTIAATEAGRAFSEAQEEALQQAIEQTGVSPNDVVRTWRTIMDGKQRDSHSYLNGKQSVLNQPFLSSSGARLRYPRDSLAPASETVNCRCSLTTTFK